MKKQYRPKYNQDYYWIQRNPENGSVVIIRSGLWIGDMCDKWHLSIGNVYRTYKEAQSKINKLTPEPKCNKKCKKHCK